MKRLPADAKPGHGMEVCLRRGTVGEEADTVERHGLAPGQRDSEVVQRGDAIRHEALSAGLVDGRPRVVGDDHVEPALAGRNRRREPSRTSSDDEDVGLQARALGGYQRRRTSSEQKPGPSAARRPQVPVAGR